MSQGRGKHPHHISHGSGSKHFKDKPTSNFVYRPKKTSPDVISNSLEAEGSNMKHPECFEAPDTLYGNYDLLSSSTQSDSKNMHPDVSRISIGLVCLVQHSVYTAVSLQLIKGCSLNISFGWKHVGWSKQASRP